MDNTTFVPYVKPENILSSAAFFSIGVRHDITCYVNVPIAFLGILANPIVFWVWSGENFVSATTYLFKALALCDFFNDLAFFIWRFAGGLFKDVFIAILSRGSRKAAILICLLLVVVQLAKQFWPLTADTFLIRSKIQSAAKVAVVYGVTVQAVIECLHNFPLKEYNVVNQILGSMITVIAPCAVQLILMVVVVFQMRRWDQVLPSDVLNLSFQEDRRKNRRLVVTLLVITVVNFIAYSTGVTMILYIRRHVPDLSDYRFIFSPVFGFFAMVNSSAKLLYFWMILPSFRRLFAERFAELRQKLAKDSKKDSTEGE